MASITGITEFSDLSTLLVIREIPGGIINGVNLNFSLLQIPQLATETVILNGVILNVTDDYTISTNIITFINAPLPGDRLLVTYVK